ncbi:CaiB/BaiF CoA transferase family protein [Muricoccus radiodurans]|uniref:CaiB/BaiF CoA transferase family protein n=1 Tax=Muricoccus radiodurans TaxID=2231721 RepID=UPI003CF5602B
MTALDGIRVLDFSQAMAGPTAGMLLGDFGAEVIKIEPPEGESARRWGTARPGPDGQFSGLYLALNRNKRGVTLDLKSAAGQADVRGLMATADVILENFRPGVADRLGIGYEAARAIRPDIVYCSISGFGQTGPMRLAPGFDMLLQAYAGHMSITGEPGRTPVRSGPSPIDLLTGAHAAYGILVALRHRDRTGEGQMVDLSLYETAIHLLTNYMGDYTGGGPVPAKHGPFFAFLAPYGVFKARDREFYLGVESRSYGPFCNAIGRPDLAEDARFRTNPDRLRNRDALHAELFPVFASRDAAEWVALADSLGIPVSLVHDVPEVLEQPQALARDMVLDCGVDGVRVAGIPLKLSRTPGVFHTPPPRLGADNAAVLGPLRSPLSA